MSITLFRGIVEMLWRVALVAAFCVSSSLAVPFPGAPVAAVSRYPCDKNKCQICKKLPMERKKIASMCKGIAAQTTPEQLAKLPPCRPGATSVAPAESTEESQMASFLEMSEGVVRAPKCLPSSATSFMELSQVERADYLEIECVKRTEAIRETCALLLLGKCCPIELSVLKNSGLFCEEDKHVALGCNENSYCINYNTHATTKDCICNTGFQGDGVSCNPVDICAGVDEDFRSMNPCHKDATCGVSPIIFGSVACTCNTGFRGDGTSCAVINPCEEVAGAKNYHGCDSHAKCTFTVPGESVCTCRTPAWFGDGKKCTRNNLCEVNNGGCHGDAQCTRTGQGERTCACNTHFVGDGKTCKMINYCNEAAVSINNCSPGADCFPKVGAVDCKCKWGYTGDGKTCDAVNPCLIKNGGCSSFGSCAHPGPGLGKCTCNTGYSGNGVGCQPDNACARYPSVCGQNAACINNGHGAYQCNCAPGYTRNDGACVKIDVCKNANSVGMLAFGCGHNAVCSKNAAGAKICTCPAGTTGDASVNCNPTDLCTAPGSPYPCSADASCVASTAASVPLASCSCNTGFTGNGKLCALATQTIDTNVTCKENAVLYNGKCICKDGFSGVGGKECKAVDACRLAPNGGCHRFGSCSTAGPGQMRCECDAGYAGDGVSECTPVDACVRSFGDLNVGCHVDGGICRVTGPGEKTCSCKPGWEGGNQCTPIRACYKKHGGCDANAVCFESAGKAACECNQHYSGTGVSCTATDYSISNASLPNVCEKSPATNGGCAVHATCTSPNGAAVCSCNSGYRGNGNVCAEINTCDHNNGGCPENAECTQSLGGVVCTCQTGYTSGKFSIDMEVPLPSLDTVSAGQTCTPINPCEQFSNGGCQVNVSVCKMTSPGHSSCTCAKGYTGRGSQACVAIDKCGCTSEDANCNGGCNTEARCTVVNDTASCSCNTGFSGDGIVCLNEKPCHGASPCHMHAACISHATSGISRVVRRRLLESVPATTIGVGGESPYSCHCKDGYTGDGKVACEKLNPCDMNNGGCDEMAKCTNSAPSKRTCGCNSGFQGSGFMCDPIDACALNNGGCAANAWCNMTGAGNVRCACKFGFSGDGHTCAAENNCNGVHGCSVNARCIFTGPGENKCECDAHFTGNAYTKGGCAQVDYCATDNGGCAFGADCEMTFGVSTADRKFGVTCHPPPTDVCNATEQVTCETRQPNSLCVKGQVQPCVCKPGFTLVSGQCQACKEGSVKPGHGEAPCKPCPAGTSGGIGNGQRCTQCARNTFSPGDKGACSQCADGFQSEIGSSVCRLEEHAACMKFEYTTHRWLKSHLWFPRSYTWYQCKKVALKDPISYESWMGSTPIHFMAGGNQLYNPNPTSDSFCFSKSSNQIAGGSSQGSAFNYAPQIAGGFTLVDNVHCDKSIQFKMNFC